MKSEIRNPKSKIPMVPSAGTPVSLGDILHAAIEGGTGRFCDDLARFLSARHVGLAGSGLAAFDIILRVLARRSTRNEVVLPAYTAPSLLLPIRKAKLRPVIVDVSLDTFNMDMDAAAEAAGGNTLAVVAVHMFGIPCDMAGARAAAARAGTTLIEDAASALGATIGGKQAGTVGDIGFVSFNRGKNLSTVAGGAWLTDDAELAALAADETAKLPRPSARTRAALFVKLVGLSLAVRPWFYTLFHRLLGRFRDTEPHADFEPRAYTALQAGAGRSVLRRFERIAAARNTRASRVREILAGVDAIRMPRVLPSTSPAYNQVPLLLPDRAARDRALAAALNAGVECTILYDKTVCATYGLGPSEYGGGPCPNAEQLASRLLLIPCHPLAPIGRIEQAAEIVKRTVIGDL